MRSRTHTIYGYLEERPIVAALALSEGQREVARQALKAVASHESGFPGIIESEDSPWLVTRPEAGLTRQGTLDELGNYGEVTYMDKIPRTEAAKFVGPTVLQQILGRPAIAG